MSKTKYRGNKIINEIIIYGNLLNLLKFVNNVGFRFNFERLEASKLIIEKARESIKRIESYEEGIKILNKNDLSYTKVARKVNVNPETVRQWIVKKRRPPNFENKEKIVQYISKINL